MVFRVYHKAVASQEHQVTGDDWNDEHAIEDMDVFMSQYCLQIPRTGAGSETAISGEYTVNMNYTHTSLPSEFLIELKCQGKRTDSNDAPVYLRVDSDSTESRYSGSYFLLSASGPSYGSTSGPGLPLFLLPDSLSEGNALIGGRLEGYLRGASLTMACTVYSDSGVRIVTGKYVKSTNFVNKPTLSLIIPSNGYVDQLVWRVHSL
ncbi:hypothetical protein [Methanothermobacter sp. THM-1]|uniref:hypothetical protein n=1 Tax=Methanothermobacter sp. THM-1 TaxID=2606911 RepID=UPI00192D5E1A|nr:hypothetical protein [Methanothermobacter sp. THM-1]